MSFLFLAMMVMFFFKVYSIFYIVLFFEILSLMGSMLFMIFLNNKILLFYVFLTFLVMEAALNFSFLVIFLVMLGEIYFWNKKMSKDSY